MNRLNLQIVVLCTIIFLQACGTNDKPALQNDPQRILNSRPYAGLTDSIKRFPEVPELYLKRAALLSQNNLHQVATPDYQKAWELTGNENVALEYVSNLMLSNHLSEAVKLLKECVKKFRDNTEFSRRLGEVYVLKGQPEQALEQYNSIISRDSFNFEAWYDKGSVLLKQKDTSQAVYSLEKSFRLMPINYSGMALAGIYVAKKNPRALEICNILLSRDTGKVQTEPLFMKGVYFSDAKQYDEAIKAFDGCISRDWKMTDAYIEKGIILYEKNKIPEALKVFSMAATVSNTDADAYYWIGRCYEKSGDRQQALLNYERAYSLDHTFYEARQALKRLNG
jgi:tetratricopeptide (TPR) repeat protein